MRMLSLSVAAAAALLLSSSAEAADWVLAAQATDGAKFYLDLATITDLSGGKQAWEKVVFARPERGMVRSVELRRYNCSERTEALVSYVAYRQDGSPGETNTTPDFMLHFRPVTPDSVGETIFNLLCPST